VREKVELAHVKQLLSGALPELGPGPHANTLEELAVKGALDSFLGKSAISPRSRELAYALLLLWHGHLDAAHVISQAIETTDGSFVHGIVHRREPDYGNAAYWFRRVGNHPTFPEIAARVRKLLEAKGNPKWSAKLLVNGAWDPFAFIQLCETAAEKPVTDPQVSTLREIQAIETEVLLQYFLDVP
jgi:hypothetical protein